MAPIRSAQEEEAFRIWSTTGEQNDAKTAELTGIPRSNIGYWRRSGNWAARWQDIVGPEADDASRQAREMMRLASPLVARRLIQIIGGERPLVNTEGNVVYLDGKAVMVPAADHKDAIAAAKLLASYNWGLPAMTPVEFPENGAIPATYAVSEAHPDEAPETVEALKASVSSMIEATVQSVNTRTARRPGRKRV